MNGPSSEVEDTSKKGIETPSEAEESRLTVLLQAADCVLHQVPVL
jgi:hypothetical protein